MKSHPIRVCGLKCEIINRGNSAEVVAPHTGAWIEMKKNLAFLGAIHVEPHMGAWIEITA